MEKAESNVRQRTLKAIHSMKKKKKSELARVVRPTNLTAFSHPVSTPHSIPKAQIQCFYDAEDKNASE